MLKVCTYSIRTLQYILPLVLKKTKTRIGADIPTVQFDYFANGAGAMPSFWRIGSYLADWSGCSFVRSVRLVIFHYNFFRCMRSLTYPPCLWFPSWGGGGKSIKYELSKVGGYALSRSGCFYSTIQNSTVPGRYLYVHTCIVQYKPLFLFISYFYFF